MSRRGMWAGAVVAVLLISAALFWFLRGEDATENVVSPNTGPTASAVNAPLKFDRKASAWEQPIEPRGSQLITGRVVDSKGAAVARATVTATQMHGEEVLSDLHCKCDDECGQKLLECSCPEASTQLVEHVLLRTGEAPPLARTTTDAEGRFTLLGLAAGEVALWADASRLIGFRSSVKVGDAEVELRVDEGRTVKGKVSTGDDKPAAGALVTGIYVAHSRFFDVTARADGTFELGPIPKDGALAVVAMKDGLLPDNDHFRPSENAWSSRQSELRLVLHAPRALSGTVTRDGTPVEGVEVTVEGQHKKKKVRSDAQGAFRFSGLRPGRYDVSASSQGDIAHAAVNIERTLDKDGVCLELARGYVIRGSVTDGAGQPLEGVEVSAQSDFEGSESSKTTAAGTYELPPVPPGEWMVSADGEGLLESDPKRVTVSNADVRLDLSLQRGSPISGVVLDPNATPIIAARVSAVPLDPRSEELGDSHETVDGGSFLIDRLRPGAYELTVVADGFRPLSQPVTAPTSGLRVVLSEGSSIVGVVVEPNGQPVVGARIFVANDEDVERRGADVSRKGGDQTDASGRFVVKGLEAMKARVWASAFTERTEDEKAFVPSMRIGLAKVVVPESGSVEVRVTMPEAMSLSGIVLDESSSPVAGAIVRAESEREEQAPSNEFGMGSATSGADGRFTIEGLVSGKVWVNGGKEGYEPTSARKLTAVAGQKNVVVRLTKLPEVTGRVVDENGTPLTEFRLQGSVKRTEDGRFSAPVWFGKETKESFLDFSADGFAPRRVRFPRFKGQKELGDVRLEKGRALSGRVVDAKSGAPVFGAVVSALSREEQEKHGAATGRATTDRQGRFKLDRVDASATLLEVRHADFVRYSQPFELRAEELVVRLDPGASLEVTATYTDGKPARGIVFIDAITEPGDIWRREGNGYLSDGRYLQRGLVPNSYRVRVDATDKERPDAFFRPVLVQLADKESKAVTLTESTDGVELQLVWSSPPHPSAYAMLYTGAERATAPLPDWRQLDRSEAQSFDEKWSARHVLPGTYSLFIFANPGISRRVITVTSEPKQQLTLSFPTQFEKLPNAYASDDD